MENKSEHSELNKCIQKSEYEENEFNHFVRSVLLNVQSSLTDLLVKVDVLEKNQQILSKEVMNLSAVYDGGVVLEQNIALNKLSDDVQKVRNDLEELNSKVFIDGLFNEDKHNVEEFGSQNVHGECNMNVVSNNSSSVGLHNHGFSSAMNSTATPPLQHSSHLLENMYSLPPKDRLFSHEDIDLILQLHSQVATSKFKYAKIQNHLAVKVNPAYADITKGAFKSKVYRYLKKRQQPSASNVDISASGGSVSPPPQSSVSQPPQKKARISACNSCKAKKLKCGEGTKNPLCSKKKSTTPSLAQFLFPKSSKK